MLETLKIKCENLMTFIPSNLYIHSNEDHETLRFSRLTIPDFLSHYIEDSIEKLIKEKESLSEEEILDNQVYLYKDPFKMCYLTIPVTAIDGSHYTVTLGPLITDQLTTEEVRYMGFKMKLSSDNCFILESFYGIVPFYDQMQMIRIASLFLDYLPVVPHLPQIVREDHSIALPEEAKSIESKFETFDFVEKNYATEARMLGAVEIGDVDFIKNMLNMADAGMTIPTRFPGDPLREQKNLTITLNSIAMRAALRGGLSQSIAHSLSHNFAIRVEHQMSVESITKLSNEIMLTYAESVRKYALKGKSEMIIDAVTYIRSNLVENISLSDIADELHVSKEHLSRQFKEEMGLSPTDFIHKSKTEESCNLLKSKRYSVSDIAYTFGYSSPAHYTKMFKKFMGLSPKQYQLKDNGS